MKDRQQAKRLLIAAVVILPLGIMVGGWAVSVLWNWALVPLGAPRVGVAHGWILLVLARFLAGHEEPDRKEESPIQAAVAKAILAPLLMLGFSWVVLKIVGLLP